MECELYQNAKFSARAVVFRLREQQNALIILCTCSSFGLREQTETPDQVFFSLHVQ